MQRYHNIGRLDIAVDITLLMCAGFGEKLLQVASRVMSVEEEIV